ncbi:MAG TPA: hypothetical protein VKD90_21615, partial [Gemmataceae bacterium]|nr:hypothetical protein [Gemmataceae bacterium]
MTRRLAFQSLEEREVPYSGPIDYLVTDGAGVENAWVVLMGNGSSGSGATNDQGVASIPAPQPPFYGVGGTELWDADVVLPPGYDFYINKEFAIGGPYWSGGQISNAVTLAEVGKPTPLCPDGTCAPAGTELMPDSADANAGPSTAGSAVSPSGVRYFDGVFELADTDLASEGLGGPWSQTRTWSNAVRYTDFGVGPMAGYPYYVDGVGTSGLAINQRLGHGWVNSMLPRLRFLGDDFFESGTSRSGMYFDKIGPTTWSPGLYYRTSAALINNEIVITDEVGNKAVFYDNTATPANRRGQFKRYVRATGDVIEVTGYTSGGDVAEVRRVQGQLIESWVFTFGSGPILASRLTGVALRRSTD